MKKIWIPALAMFFTWQASLTAQEHVTNAFDDLKRTGTMNEQQSEMRQPASEEALAKLMGNPLQRAISVLPKTVCTTSV